MLGRDLKSRPVECGNKTHPFTGAAPGGWGWTHLPGGVPDADDTSGAILALTCLCAKDQRETTASHPHPNPLPQGRGGSVGPSLPDSPLSTLHFPLAFRWLLDLQNTDGGWPTFCRGWGRLPFDKSSPDITAHAIRALLSADRQGENQAIVGAIERGFSYLTSVQRPDGSWVPLWFGNQSTPDGSNPVLGTARVLPALAEDSPEAAMGARFLLDAQNSDGGWGGDGGIPSSSEESALALIALTHFSSDEIGRAVARGADYLIEVCTSRYLADAQPHRAVFRQPVVFRRAISGRLDGRSAWASASTGRGNPVRLIRNMSALRNRDLYNIKRMPADRRDRDAIRREAASLAAGMDTSRPPSWEDLSRRAGELLEKLGLPAQYLGYTMVCLGNAFWSPRFQAIPASRRLFLLPHCLSDKAKCMGRYDSEGLHCAACGSCDISYLKAKAENMGYGVLVAEGTPAVIIKILEGDTDAILGVACLDSLESSFVRISELGIPYMAVPLLVAGCENTQAETDMIEAVLDLAGDGSPAQPRSYLKLLRAATGLFDRQRLAELLSPYISPPSPDMPEAISATHEIASDWLTNGGKRLRPFITIAAYSVARWGDSALTPDFDPDESIPLAAKRLAIAIEAMHKASLIHDDIEDDDEFRYGRETVHHAHGVGPAVNAGDYLVGLGYRLVAGEAASLGPECATDILSALAAAHIDLCRGQGAELLWRSDELRPLDALQAYALKTAPAFEVALYAGLRAAGREIDLDNLHRFCVYVGEAYQVLNDLDDWDDADSGHSLPGLDAIAQRPTVLRAFALEAGGGPEIQRLTGLPNRDQAIKAIGALYESLGAFDKADTLYARLRDRALDMAARVESGDLAELFGFLARLVLSRRTPARER